MPMHDWTRVKPNVYHMLHGFWLMQTCRALNNGILPPGYYAMYEQVTRNVQADLLALRDPIGGPPRRRRPAATAVPAAGLVQRARRHVAKLKSRRVAVRHNSGHDMVAAVEFVSRGNKSSRQAVTKFVDKVEGLLDAGVHVLLVDPLPATRRTPNGLHPLVWAAATERPRRRTPPYTPPAGRPLTAASYQAGDEIVAAVEAFAVGGPVPDMPLWLADDRWVTVPLERTYAEAFADVPAVWRDALTGGPPA